MRVAETGGAASTEAVAVRSASGDEAVIAIAEDGRLLACDERLCQLTAMPARVLASRTIEPILAWLRQSDDEACTAIATLIAAPPLQTGGEIACSDGRVVEWSATRIDAGGRIWSFRDATRYRAAAGALTDAETWLRLLTAHQHGVVIEVDADARVVGFWATEAETLFGVPLLDLRGAPLPEVLAPHGAELDGGVRAAIAAGRSSSFELVTDVGDDRRVYSVSVAPLPAVGGQRVGATLLVEDTTQQARLKAQLQQAERLASIGLLAAGVAHEINNPLGYMLLNVQRLRRGLAEITAVPAEGRPELLADLERSALLTLEGLQRVQEIVRDLRHFARSDYDEPRVAVDIHRVLGTTLEIVAAEIDRRARLVRDFGPVPAVRATEGRLGQVFLNLVLNAAQAIPEGDPTAHEIRVVTRTDARGHAMIEIHDTGEGIPDHVVRHIFDPFFTTKLPGIGSGLGLAICHGITTSFGGFISVESREGRGSVFCVVLPGDRANEAS